MGTGPRGFGRASLVASAAMAATMVGATLAPAAAAPTTLRPAATATATEPVPGTGVARPRILYDRGSESALASRLDREPYATVFRTASSRADAYQGRTLGDHGIVAQRDLTRAAKQRAFEYALDRTVVAGSIVPFASAEARRAAGDFARDVLLQILDRSRMALDPPIGGWDRDISTSEEIINAATTYDTLLGAGYDLGADRAEIVRRISAVTQELYENFIDPSTVGGVTDLHQNNHRTKSGAAMALAAVALADDVDPALALAWWDQGVDYVDDLQRHTLITGDGAYAEGPFYYRFTLQNLLPFVNAWERLLGDRSWTTTSGLTVPALAHTPLFARTQRWMIDLTLPDGSLAPIDDGNPGRSSYPGILPTWLPDTEAGYWRWANAPRPYETDGNIDLAAEAIVAYDDGVTPSAPSWEPTQFYVEGGNAILRSDWTSDATMALILGEHDTASEFGRDRTGTGRYPQSHEHPEPGAFLLYAHGEHLALDPGYLSFTDHAAVNRPEHHNVLLVDGEGPADYLTASFAWAEDPTGRPPAEGQATIAHTLDSSAADVATVATAYRGASITRRFLFGDDRYLVVADQVDADAGVELAWMLHGNGGGTSGGTYADTAAGGTWTRGDARLSSGIAVSTGAADLTTETATHEAPGGVRSTHTALRATATTTDPDGGTQAVQVLYPSRSGASAPTVERTTTASAATVSVADPAADRNLTVVQPRPTTTATGAGVRAGTGLLVVDRTGDGSLRSAWADGASVLTDGDRTLLSMDEPGSLAVRLDDGAAAVVATGGAETVTIGDLGFEPAAIDGSCGFTTSADGTTLATLNRERRLTVRRDGGNARPAADPGPDRRVDPGAAVRLDGTASCDSDGDALTYRWELVSAPAGSSWLLQGADTARPTLDADRVGPYRVRLVVTDDEGQISQANKVVVIAGPQCADGVDDDLDGLIDTDDPDCDGSPPPPTTTTTDATPATSTTSTPPTAPPSSAAPAVPVAADPRYTG